MSERTVTGTPATSLPPPTRRCAARSASAPPATRPAGRSLPSRYWRAAPPATATNTSFSVDPGTLARMRLMREIGIPKPSTTRLVVILVAEARFRRRRPGSSPPSRLRQLGHVAAGDGGPAARGRTERTARDRDRHAQARRAARSTWLSRGCATRTRRPTVHDRRRARARRADAAALRRRIVQVAHAGVPQPCRPRPRGGS